MVNGCTIIWNWTISYCHDNESKILLVIKQVNIIVQRENM